MQKNLFNTLTVTNDYLNFPENFYSFSHIDSLDSPQLISMSPLSLGLLGLKESDMTPKDITALLNGEKLLQGSQPYSMVYAGHQFGHFVPQLGDGRAINLGSINGWHLQLKGAGLTQYSRQGDGKAVLRSSIREYLMSEAMSALDIPTTRALAIITSFKEKVIREQIEPAAIVLRLSPSWIRFGTFEYFYHRNKMNELKQLMDFVIVHHFNHLCNDPDRYKKFFFEIVDRTALLVAKWQAYGFMHGVMNTDNMSILGLTIDYGPYAFMDRFDVNTICNHTDYEGRYAYCNQASIAQWNLTALAECFSNFTQKNRLLEYLEGFSLMQENEYLKIMQRKLGLIQSSSLDFNRDLIAKLIHTLDETYIDYTLFFTYLTTFSFDAIMKLSKNHSSMKEWLNEYKKVIGDNSLSQNTISHEMKKVNPKYILKNYMIEEAIQKATHNDFSLVNDLLNIAHKPFDDHPKFKRYKYSTPDALCNRPLSCSS